MSYSVKEIYSSIQLEGFHQGRPAIFLRFTGCNLWSGLERDRESAICRFCDTDFVGTDGVSGGTFATAAALAVQVANLWNDANTYDATRFVVCTGGEPLLQAPALARLRRAARAAARGLALRAARVAATGVDRPLSARHRLAVRAEPPTRQGSTRATCGSAREPSGTNTSASWRRSAPIYKPSQRKKHST